MRQSMSVTVIVATALGSGVFISPGADAGNPAPPGAAKAPAAPVEHPARTEAGRGQVDPRDRLLAALGAATLDCLGTVAPSTYGISGGILERSFEACTTGDRAALGVIDALLGVQHSAEGKAERLPEHYASRWTRSAERVGRSTGDACPTWTLQERMNEPTPENVRRLGSRTTGQKSNARYAVRADGCADGRCAVERAARCAGAFGDAFIVRLDPRRAEVVVDPSWWLLNDTYPDDENPFKTSGYYHPMSYSGRVPGARFGTLARSTELCSRWDESTNKHYIHYLVPIECSPGWKCMSYCGG
jgi:hypothetical protein